MPLLPPQPGVYVVEMLNDEAVSVNADRPGIADHCIRVNRANCKYGQAKNLARRERDYVRTFGRENFRFRFYAATDNYAAVEAELAVRLAAYRIPGQTGRLNEWLHGIAAEEVEAIVRSVLHELGAGPPQMQHHNQKAVLVSSAQGPRTGAEPLGVSTSRLLDAASYLQAVGMPVLLLRELHHSPRRNETFTSTLRYFSKKFDLRLNNQLYGARLIDVADGHRQGESSFSVLVGEALRKYPK